MIIRVRPDGTVLAPWDDRWEPRRTFNAIPRRAGHVIPIEEGPSRGRFHVDLSPLAGELGDETLRVCLTRVFPAYGDAVAAEVRAVARAIRHPR